MTAKAGLLDFYTSNSWEASRRFTLNFGVNAQAFMLNGDWSVEPRVSCQWHTSEHGTLSFGYGLNSQVEKLDVYFVEKDGNNVNHDLNMTRAHHMQMSYLYMLNADLALRAEVLYQRMFDMPIAEEGTYADATVSYKVNRKSVTHEFALKLINIFQTKVPFKHVYNYKTNEVETFDWGVAVPNICYRINF